MGQAEMAQYFNTYYILNDIVARITGNYQIHQMKSAHLSRLALSVIAEEPPSTTILVGFMIDGKTFFLFQRTSIAMNLGKAG
jgi:hypothetical protein